jgi:hypothetical protein
MHQRISLFSLREHISYKLFILLALEGGEPP